MTIQMIIHAVMIASAITLIKEYYSLRKSVVKFWKIANPNMSKKEIRKILNNLYELEYTQDASLEAQKMIDNHNLEIKKLLMGQEKKIIDTLEMMCEMGCAYTRLVEHLENSGMSDVLKDFQEDLNYINSTYVEMHALWPDKFYDDATEIEEESDDD